MSFFNIDECVKRADRIPGHMHLRELKKIAEIADTDLDEPTWVELGALCGRSLLVTGLALPGGSTLISVDRYWGSRIEGGITAHDVYAEIIQDRPDINLVTVRADSKEAAGIFARNSVDYVFIDAGHTYEDVRADIRSWLPNLSSEGMLLGHDYASYFPGVVEAVDQLASPAKGRPEFSVKNEVGSLWTATRVR